MKTPTTLIIMDGFGLRGETEGNAIRNAHTPNLDRLYETCAHCALSASGLNVGLPKGQMGNSEVGHINIGAGRIVFQDLPRISRAISDGSFFENPAYGAVMDACRAEDKALHLMGLLSDGGIHSHITHLWALLQMAKQRKVPRVYIHAFLDGRDTSPVSGAGFVSQCVEKCKELGIGSIATVMGRYYAMDRDNRWERVERAYAAMVYGEGNRADDPVSGVKESYAAGVTDEFVAPIVLKKDAGLMPGDGVIVFNFRPDRARELTRTLADPEFNAFSRRRGFFPLHFACTTEYDATMPNVAVAFARQKLPNLFGEYVSRLGLRQFRIAETEKYAHVTFFFNGGSEKAYPGEDRVIIPSPKVATYDLQPEMSAPKVADEAVRRILTGAYDVVILNFANCDMVGHTGNYEAARRAVEAVDEGVGKVQKATEEMGGVTIITADHGNAEQMFGQGGLPHTAHTTNPVPFLISGVRVKLREGGRLCDIAPTMLDLMGLQKPPEMEGKTLIVP
ncbi:MAG: 2,3-bisphosphoglycerate-independent phosphoglycerate mutase [Oscillospiraceae bacterium]|nr:2,3-bisphosphoglycerate-independent phosphoglycerate mutase [Oscillospiraceae bacterium]